MQAREQHRLMAARQGRDAVPAALTTLMEVLKQATQTDAAPSCVGGVSPLAAAVQEARQAARRPREAALVVASEAPPASPSSSSPPLTPDDTVTPHVLLTALPLKGRNCWSSFYRALPRRCVSWSGEGMPFGKTLADDRKRWMSWPDCYGNWTHRRR